MGRGQQQITMPLESWQWPATGSSGLSRMVGSFCLLRGLVGVSCEILGKRKEDKGAGQHTQLCQRGIFLAARARETRCHQETRNDPFRQAMLGGRTLQQSHGSRTGEGILTLPWEFFLSAAFSQARVYDGEKKGRGKRKVESG
jgi:hypothetical protein